MQYDKEKVDPPLAFKNINLKVFKGTHIHLDAYLI